MGWVAVVVFSNVAVWLRLWSLGLGAALLALAACAPHDAAVRVGPGDTLDVATTAIGLSQGFTEANPVLAECGPAAPACALVLKPALKSAYVGMGMTPAEANTAVELPSWMGGCANVLTLGGAAPPVAIVAGVGCGIGYLAEIGAIPPHERSKP